MSGMAKENYAYVMHTYDSVVTSKHSYIYVSTTFSENTKNVLF